MQIYCTIKTNFRPLVGATIAPNLVPWVSEKIFSLDMVENDIDCVSDTNDKKWQKCARKQNVQNDQNVPDMFCLK